MSKNWPKIHDDGKVEPVSLKVAKDDFKYKIKCIIYNSILPYVRKIRRYFSCQHRNCITSTKNFVYIIKTKIAEICFFIKELKTYVIENAIGIIKQNTSNNK